MISRLFKSNSTQSNTTHDSLFGWLLPPYNNSGFFNRAVKEAMLGVAIGLMKAPLSITLAYLEASLYTREELTEVYGEMKQFMPEYDKLTVFFICVIAPVVEELFCQKILRPALESLLNRVGFNPSIAKNSALICNSLLFASNHVRGGKLQSFAGGMLYGEAAILTEGRLTTSVIAHSTNNILPTLYLAANGIIPK